MSVPALKPGTTAAWRPLAVAGVLAFWLFLLYGRALYEVTPLESRQLWGLLGALTLAFSFLNPVFRAPMLFAGSYLIGLGLIAWAVLKLVRSWPARAAFGLIGIVALAFPLFLPVTYGTYRSPVETVAGHEARWLTEPGNPYSGAFKQAQRIHEAECDYHLAGWSADGSLAYTSACWPGVWRYDAASEQTRWSLVGWLGRFGAARVQRWDGQHYLSPPAALDDAGGFPLLTLERSASPDGRWEAVVVRWFYGPSDVVLIGSGD